jgi:hypothetical protein
MFSEPLPAHPAEIGGVHTTWHTRILGMMTTAINTMTTPTMNSIWFSPHSGRRITILTRGKVTVCALVHTASGT